MKKIIGMMMALLCLFSCDNDGIDGPKRKERVDIPLTKAEEGVVARNNNFAFDLFREIAKKESNTNTFISPLSVTAVFSILNNGANGLTQEEIQEVLGYQDLSVEEINDFYLKILEAAVDIDPQVEVTLANSIWIREGFPVLEPFIQVNKKYYQAEVRNIDFSHQNAAGQINQWVSGKTNGRIPKMIDQLDPSAIMHLINALYFNGEWEEPFDKSSTKDELFTNKDGSQINAPLMYQATYNAYATNEEYALTSLYYGNRAFEMVFLLPHEGVELSSVIAGLTNDSWQECLRLHNMPCKVKLKLPRFKVEYNVELNDVLKELGIKSAFKGDADFSAISNQSLFVSRSFQKTYIEVNEKGTEAAANTDAEMMLTSPGPRPEQSVAEFYMNRPFLYFLRETSTGTIFFMGKIEHL